MADGGARFDVQLDERHADKLRVLAERTPALDEVEPEPSSIVALLDSIPGAFERAQQGLREIEAGQGIPLDEF